MYKSKYTKPVLRSASLPRPLYKTTMQHVLLLDWDDTLMPTSYLKSNFDIYIDRSTKRVTTFRLKKKSKSKEDEIRRTLKEAGSAAFRMLKAFYLYFVDNTSGRNLYIVTNGAEHWLWNSLTVAGALCSVYHETEQLLRGQNTHIIYARKYCVNPNYWKMASFDHILNQYLEQKQCHKLNVITIGDQWTDHYSIEMTSTFRRHHRAISHHRFKLYPAADAHYMAAEMRYITKLIESAQGRCLLLKFASFTNALVIEFDGYQPDNDSVESLDSPREKCVPSTHRYVPLKTPRFCLQSTAKSTVNSHGKSMTKGLDPKIRLSKSPNVLLSK